MVGIGAQSPYPRDSPAMRPHATVLFRHYLDALHTTTSSPVTDVNSGGIGVGILAAAQYGGGGNRAAVASGQRGDHGGCSAAAAASAVVADCGAYIFVGLWRLCLPAAAAKTASQLASSSASASTLAFHVEQSVACPCLQGKGEGTDHSGRHRQPAADGATAHQ